MTNSLSPFQQLPKIALDRIIKELSSTDKRALCITCTLFRNMIPGQVSRPLQARVLRSHAEIRLDVGKAVELRALLLPHTNDALTNFLESFDLTIDDLKKHNISKQALERLITIESSLWGSLRWINIDALVEKLIHYPMLRWTDTGIDSKAHLWTEGRGLPLKNEAALKWAYGASGFRQGAEFVFARGTHLTLYAILAYQIISSAKAGAITSFSKFFELLWNADEKAFEALFLYTQVKQVVGSALALPIIWGVGKAIINSRDAKLLTDQRLQEIGDFFAKETTNSFWHNTLRWLLPLHPIDRCINELERYLRWDGRMELAQRIKAFNILIDFATESCGYTKIAALHLLAKITHGHALKQLILIKDSFSEEVFFHTLSMKTKAFEVIQLNAPPLQDAFQKEGILGLLNSFYAHYLKWTLAASDSKKMAVTMLALKTTKTAITLTIFVTIFRTLVNYLACPHREGFTLVNGYPPSSYHFTEECFNAYVNQFNSVPGQPVETLLDLISKTNFIGNYTLNLTYKGLNGASIAQILQTFAQNHVQITRLNLAGNAISTVQDVSFLWPELPPQLLTLNLSSNQIDHVNSLASQAIGNGLTDMIHLTSLDLSHNKIGYHDSSGSLAIGEGLNFLTDLISLDLSNNYLGYHDNNGTQAIGNSLTSLRALKLLNFSTNYLGYLSDSGTRVIGSSLANLTALTSLDLSSNYIGYREGNGTQAIGNSFAALTSLTSINLSNNWIGYHNSLGSQALGNSIAFLNALTSLDLSENVIGYNNMRGFISIFDAVTLLPRLQYVGIASSSFQSNDSSEESIVEIQMIARDIAEAVRPALGNVPTKTNFPIVISPFQAEVYLWELPDSTTDIDLSGQLLGVNRATFTTLFQGLLGFTSLKQLNLCCNALDKLDPPISLILANTLGNLTTLTSIDLSGNYIGYRESNGTQAIGRSIAFLTALSSLNLSNNYIGYTDSIGIQVVGEGLIPLSNISSIDFSNNFIGYTDSSGTQAIGNGLNSKISLNTIKFANNYIGYKNSYGSQVLGSSLGTLTSLTSLDLSDNSIGLGNDEGVLAISRSIPSILRLNYLNLGGNYIGSTGPEGTQALLNALPNLKHLTDINLAGVTHAIWPNGAAGIAEITDHALAQACQEEICWARNLTIPRLQTSSASRLALPGYLRLTTDVSMYVLTLLPRLFPSKMKNQTPALSCTHTMPAIRPLTVSPASLMLGGATVLFLACKIKSCVVNWWQGKKEPSLPAVSQAQFEQKTALFGKKLKKLEVAFTNMRKKQLLPDTDAKWLLWSVEDYRDDIEKLQKKSRVTVEELHELELDIAELETMNA